MTTYLLAFGIGVIAGLRAMTAPAAVSWAAKLGWLKLSGTWLSFLGHTVTPWILTALAALELVSDQLPKTPSRKVPVQFGTRILMGGVCGAAIAIGVAMKRETVVDTTLVNGAIGLTCGIAGAIVGTLGGAEGRKRLAEAFKRDLPAALIEDAIAIAGAYFIVRAVA